MTTYLLNTGKMIGSMVAVLLILASIRTVLEFVSPTYSGFGPWQPMAEVIYAALLFSGSLLLVEALASTRPKGRHAFTAQLVAAGAVCALGASGPLIRRLVYPVTHDAPSELAVIVTAIVCTAVVRIAPRRAET